MTDSDQVRAEDAAYRRELGARLREVRKGQGLSLTAAQEKSGGEWKASVIGAAERGSRGVSTCSLVRMARFYGCDPAWLLTGDEPEPTLVARTFTAITASAAGAVRKQLLDRALREGGDDLYLAIRGFLEVEA